MQPTLLGGYGPPTIGAICETRTTPVNHGGLSGSNRRQVTGACPRNGRRNMANKPLADDEIELFVPAFWHKGARKFLVAEKYGLKAFRIVVKKKPVDDPKAA